MQRSLSLLAAAAATAALGASSAGAQGVDVRVTVENIAPAGGFNFTPVWLGLGDGTFDTFNPGETLNPTFSFLENVAEIGVTGDITAAFAADQPAGQQTTLAAASGSPPLAPGEVNSFDFFDVDATDNRYLSYASMLVPSNDLFVSNADPLARSLFDSNDAFVPFSFELTGFNVYDAGTEENDPSDGGAFVAGVVGTEGTTTNNAINRFVETADFAVDLSELLSTLTPDGQTISSGFGSNTPLLRISVTAVPEPTSLALLGLGGLAALRRRR